MYQGCVQVYQGYLPGMFKGSIILLLLSLQPPDGPASFHSSPSTSSSTPYLAITPTSTTSITSSPINIYLPPQSPLPTRAVPLANRAAAMPLVVIVATTVGVVGGVIIIVILIIVVCTVVGVAHARRSGNNSRYVFTARNCIGFVLHPSLTTFDTLSR